MKINKSKCDHTNCNCHSHHKIGRYPIHEDRRQILQEGTKYDKKAATKLASSGLFDEETSKRIVDALFKEDIHAFVHSPSWLEKYLIGIVNMLIKYCDGDRSKAQEFLTNSIEVFEEYLTWVKEARPKLTQENQLALDNMFNEQWSYEDVVKAVDGIRQGRDAESAEKLKNTEFSEDSDFELVPIESFEDFNSKFGGRATGDGSSDAYAGGGGTAWCHTNNHPTYDSWVKNGRFKFYVLAHKDWQNIPFDKESNSQNPKDDYGNSLIALLVDTKTGRLSKATLRCNHIGVPSNADNQYTTYAELSSVVGFNVEEAVKNTLEIDPNAPDDDDDLIECPECGALYPVEEMSLGDDNEYYCYDCWNNLFFECADCGTVCSQDYANWLDDPYCDNCFGGVGFYCTRCGDACYYDHGYQDPSGDWWCEHCMSYYADWTWCVECNEPFWDDDLYSTPDGPMCRDCLDDSEYVRCDDCGSIVDEDDAYNIEGAWYCEGCFEDHLPEEDVDEELTTHNHRENKQMTNDEIVDILEKSRYTSFVVDEGDYIKIRGKWRTTTRRANSDYIDIKVLLDKKLGAGNFDLVYERNDIRDGEAEVSCSLRLELKNPLKEESKSWDEHQDIMQRKTSGYDKCYKIVKKARTSNPIDTNALNDARDHFGYDLYKMCLDDVLKEMDNLDETFKPSDSEIQKEYDNYCKDLGIDSSKKSSKNRFMADYGKHLNDFYGIKDIESKLNQVSKAIEEDYEKFELIPDNRKMQYSIGGKDVPYTSYEDAKAHMKDDYNIEDYREELQAYIDKETGRPHTFYVDATFDGKLCIEINWGDWKHEHGYADYLVRHFFMDKGLGVEVDVDVTSEDGSDTYSATHYYELNDIYFSGRVVSESTEGFQKEFYNGYVILKNRAGDGWDIYSYDGTPEKVKKAYLEDEGYATLKDAKAEIDKWNDETMNGAHYGGAFDIADDQYFTRDDLLYFADEVLGNVAETFEGTFDIGGVWFEDGCVVTQIVDDEGNMFEDTTRVDMRKMKEPWHLRKAYSQQVSANIIKQIKELKGMDESVVSSSHEFDDDVDDLSYYYDDESWEEPDVSPRKDFDAEGREYTWVKRHGDVLHLDFDNWAVWEAYCHDDAESYYFIVDEDTGFIDWGPCDTQQEAQDFLDSKKFDWDSEYENEGFSNT